MKSSGNRSALRLTAGFRALVVTPYIRGHFLKLICAASGTALALAACQRPAPSGNLAPWLLTLKNSCKAPADFAATDRMRFKLRMGRASVLASPQLRLGRHEFRKMGTREDARPPARKKSVFLPYGDRPYGDRP